MGVGSKAAKISGSGRPNSASISGRIVSHGSGGTLSCKLFNSASTDGGSTSGRVLAIWPSLMNVGPSSSSASRRRTAGGTRSDSSTPRRSNRRGMLSRSASPSWASTAPKPWRAITSAMRR